MNMYIFSQCQKYWTVSVMYWHDDDVYLIELQHGSMLQNVYPYGPAKTAYKNKMESKQQVNKWLVEKNITKQI
jgi:hypothetical protein